MADRYAVSECWALASADVGEDTSAILSWLQTAESLRDTLIYYGAQYVIREHFSSLRRQTGHSASAGRIMSSPDVVDARGRMREARIEFWRRYTLWGHTPLREATRPLLRESALKRNTCARTHLVRAKFEIAIADRLKNDIIVVGEQLLRSEVEDLATTMKITEAEFEEAAQ